MAKWRWSGGLVTGGRRSAWGLLALGLLLSVVAGLLARHVLSTYAPTRRVLVAAHPVAPFTHLKATDLTWTDRPAVSVPADAVTDEGEADGTIQGQLLPGDILRKGYFTAANSGGSLARQLNQNNTRAIALPGDLVGALLAQLAPGDRLELVAVQPVQTEKVNTTAAAQVTASAEVLAVTPPSDPGRGADKGSVIVAMEQTDAARTDLAIAAGRLFVHLLPHGLQQAPDLPPITPEAMTGK